MTRQVTPQFFNKIPQLEKKQKKSFTSEPLSIYPLFPLLPRVDVRQPNLLSAEQLRMTADGNSSVEDGGEQQRLCCVCIYACNCVHV